MNTNIVQQINTQKLLVLLPKACSMILVVFTAYAMVELLWVLTDSSEPSMIISAPILNDAPQRPQNNGKIAIADKIALNNLYGKIDYSAPQREQVIAAPDTQLNLKLMGILATGGEDGLAIISSNNNEEVYKVGAKVPGNATLTQVLPDRVILESRRGLETLRLPMEKLEGISITQTTREPPPENRLPSRKNKPVERKLHDYRKQFIRDPASINQFADVQPVNTSDGRFQGYKISPKSEQALFNDIGLENGDIVTSVNGIELDQPAKGLSALRKLMNAKELNLTVLRNGQPISIQREFDR